MDRSHAARRQRWCSACPVCVSSRPSASPATCCALTVETGGQVEGCHGCGVLAVPHGRREHPLKNGPFGHRRVRVPWRKRVWRCLQPAFAMVTSTEMHALASPRALLTCWAVTRAANALSDDDTTVNALARRLDVACTRSGTRSRSGRCSYSRSTSGVSCAHRQMRVS